MVTDDHRLYQYERDDRRHRRRYRDRDRRRNNKDEKSLSASSTVMMATPMILRSIVSLSKDDAAVKEREMVKLINDNFEFESDGIAKLLMDNREYLVIGVIGPQSSGKSSIMRELAGISHLTENVAVFPVSTLQNQIDQKHCTRGIDVHVTAERVILLDSQAVMSASLLAHFLRPDMMLPSDISSPEHYLDLHDIQLVTFLLSVCDVVVVVSDVLFDRPLYKLLRTCEDLQSSLAELNGFGLTSPTDGSTSRPVSPAVFVRNKAPAAEMNDQVQHKLVSCTSRCFLNSRLISRNGLDLFVIPRYDDVVNDIVQQKPMQVYWKELVSHLFSFPMASVNRVVSERDWLKDSNRIWEVIRKSSAIFEYCRALHPRLT